LSTSAIQRAGAPYSIGTDRPAQNNKDGGPSPEHALVEAREVPMTRISTPPLRATANGLSRRRLLAGAATAATGLVAAPFVHTAGASGKLTLGIWDHWVPGANTAFTEMVNAWAAKEKVEVQIDYISSQGGKLLLTIAAEAQARSGHDIITINNWLPAQHSKVLEPVDDILKDLNGQYGDVDPAVEYLSKIEGTWRAVPSTRGTLTYPACTRIDYLKQHADLDVTAIYPAGKPANRDLHVKWNWEAFLLAAQGCHKAGVPFGLPLGTTADSVQWVGSLFLAYGAALVDAKGANTVKSDAVKQVLDYAKRLYAFLPPDVPAWDDASNNKWLVSGKGALIMNPPSAWAVAKRDAPQVAAQCWTHPMPRGPKGRYVGFTPYFYGIWSFGRNKAAAKSLIRFISTKERAEQLVVASQGYDLPPWPSFNTFKTWDEQEPPKGTLSHYPNRGDQLYSIAAQPAPHGVAQQIYSQALMTKMIVRHGQGEDLEKTLDWASSEVDGMMRG
jgi:ABC-type glycerol-3-phosphate transport system substrate-binding protein